MQNILETPQWLEKKMEGQTDVSSYHCKCQNGGVRQAGLVVIYWLKVMKVGALWGEKCEE